MIGVLLISLLAQADSPALKSCLTEASRAQANYFRQFHKFITSESALKDQLNAKCDKFRYSIQAGDSARVIGYAGKEVWEVTSKDPVPKPPGAPPAASASSATVATPPSDLGSPKIDD